MSEKINIPRGTFDILPGESSKWQKLLNIFCETANLYSYQEIVTPIFESAHLFERGVGEVTDIIEKEMYRFTDRKGREFALRPEGTAPIVRSFIENHLGKEYAPAKLYYFGPMFRYDRPQKGRYRQFHQYGVELIGSNNPYTDAEVIALADHFLKQIGIKNYTLEINSIGCDKCSPVYDAALIEYYSKHKDELCGDCVKRLEKNPKRLLDCKNEKCQLIGKEAPSILDYLDEDCAAAFEKVKYYLNLLKVDYIVNPRIIRGLDYYSNTAFEFLTTSLGSQNALLGGGRYNGLVKQLGGVDTPAVGFAGGVERLLAVAEAEGISLVDSGNSGIYVANIGAETIDYALALCAEFRSKGISVEYEIDKNNFKSQLKSANRLNIPYVCIVGSEEMEGQRFTLKEMNSGKQVTLNRSDIGEKFNNWPKLSVFEAEQTC
ncbi:MAG: histidine--tRNA ligase [Candidatus Cloacimonas sp.]|nr:histidine--tRNA ligase [Candidatus Cloacimonadota bacterium]